MIRYGERQTAQQIVASLRGSISKAEKLAEFFTGRFEQTSSIKPKPGFLFGMAFLKGPCYAAQLVKAFADGADRRVGVWIPSPGREL